MKRFIQVTCLTALLAGSTFAIAQSGGYTGPSSVALTTAKELLANGKDDQYAKLKGKLTSHKGGEDYEFTDASGKITVEIDAKHFPQGVNIDQNTIIELTGEFDKETFGESTFDVKQVKVAQ